MTAEELLDQTIESLTVRREGDLWVGDVPAWGGEYAFGGFVTAQAVSAATQAAPEDRRIHSFHAYFLKPVRVERPHSYRITSLRDGRSFATRHLEAIQDDVPTFAMTCSFTLDVEGYEYELRGDDVPDPDELEITPGPGPWIAARLGPTPSDPDGTRRSTHRAWIRINGTLPDDPHLHAALVTFATDWTETGGRPLALDGDVSGMISLDHAVWFHRPLRADEWIYFDVHSLINTGGRGLLRGAMYDSDRRLAVSMAQEMLLRPV